jgi:hypothetical protein
MVLGRSMKMLKKKILDLLKLGIRIGVHVSLFLYNPDLYMGMISNERALQLLVYVLLFLLLFVFIVTFYILFFL